MNEKELRKLWEKLKGEFDLGTFEAFKKNMDSVEKRARFFYSLTNDPNDPVDLGEYKDYEARLGMQNAPIPNLPKQEPDVNAEIKNAWFSPLYSWAKGRGGQFKLYEKGNSFVYSTYSETTEDTTDLIFYKNGGFRFKQTDPNNMSTTKTDIGNWVPNPNGVGFVITMNSGDVFDTQVNKWKISPKSTESPSQSNTTQPTTQTNTKPKDNYNIGSAQGELDYYTKNDNLNENLVKKIVSKHLHSVL